jgi:hypothetical protein
VLRDQIDQASLAPGNNSIFSILMGLITAAAVVQIYAAFSLRALYADGAHFLVHILVSRTFWILEPSRGSVEFLMQIPIVAAIKFGITDIEKLSIVFCITLEFLPLLLVGLCFFLLPADRKILFILPACHYFFGSLSAGFAPIAEGPTAAAYFWALLYGTMFAKSNRSSLLLLALGVILGCLLHQALSFLAIVLAIAAFARMRNENSPAVRSFFLGLSAWFIVVSIVEIEFAIHPRDLMNRQSFAEDLLKLHWLTNVTGSINVPAAIGMVGFGAVFLAVVFPRYEFLVVLLSFIAVAALVEGAFLSDAMVSPSLQFAARNHPTFVSLPLSIIALLEYKSEGFLQRWLPRSTSAIVTTIAIGALAWHVVGIRDWTNYLQAFREELNARSGLITWEQLLNDSTESHAQLFRRMYWSWTNPDMSILLSPKGRVSSIVMNPATVAWQPPYAADPTRIPKSQSFNGSTLSSVIGP